MVRRLPLIALVLGVTLGVGAPAAHAHRVGCNSLAILLSDLEGFDAERGENLGLPPSSGQADFSFRVFSNSDTRLFATVGEYETATEALASLGNYSRGFFEGASIDATATIVDGVSTGEASVDGLSIRVLETTVGRYIVGVVGISATADVDTLTRDVLELQRGRFPDRCLVDEEPEELDTDDDGSSAVTIGTIAGVFVIGASIALPAVTSVRRRKKAVPYRDPAP